MIKIFGKIRYHFQPELSWLISYWSLAMTPIFIALSLLYERTSFSFHVFILFGVFILLTGFGLHRYFIIEETGYLRIVTLNFFSKQRLLISDIAKINVTKSTITIILTNGDKRLFYMRKWPKKYFLDALVICESFKGEVELLDNFIQLDYFEIYKDDKKAPTVS
ncbi:EbsA family protein [Streptococcus sp. CSL10205-OR2]|uniref:EbsA family protein n=1 Tax=Streptococcus sp. CSL10205-OR2 TaxID=2980558 RepID=UPI0021DA08DA|nr:EbsA family protein [Streptococcus sp. CSL10205-OR2]MCU9533755.1 EbsA family protein [Streptococcus sp. CSL10205-OR2]